MFMPHIITVLALTKFQLNTQQKSCFFGGRFTVCFEGTQWSNDLTYTGLLKMEENGKGL